MTRKKVKLAWIQNNSSRKASLKKRRVGLFKKASELATLCDVSVCVIIYTPNNNHSALWPSPILVQKMLARFYDLPDFERRKKMLNQETYLRERIGKVQEKMGKNQKKNKEVEMSNLMHQILDDGGFDKLSISELYRLTYLVEERVEEIRKRNEFFQQFPIPLQLGSLPLPLPNQGLLDEGLQEVVETAHIESSEFNPVGAKKDRIILLNSANSLDPWIFKTWNNNEKCYEGNNFSVRTEIGPSTLHAYGGNSSGIVVNDIRMSQPPLHGINFSPLRHDMGLLRPHGNFKGYSDMNMLPPYGNINFTRGNSNASGIHDMGQSLQPYWNINNGGGNHSIGGIHEMRFKQQPHGNLGGGDNIAGSDLGLPFGIFGAGSSGGSDIGLPYDVTKAWPNQNNSP